MYILKGLSGFWLGMGTVDTLFLPYSLLTHYINKTSNLFCDFIYLSNAFDYVVKAELW